VAHILIGEPVPIPDQVGDRLSPGYAREHERVSGRAALRDARHDLPALSPTLTIET
jgi:hypothetical protein